MVYGRMPWDGPRGGRRGWLMLCVVAGGATTGARGGLSGTCVEPGQGEYFRRRKTDGSRQCIPRQARGRRQWQRAPTATSAAALFSLRPGATPRRQNSLPRRPQPGGSQPSREGPKPSAALAWPSAIAHGRLQPADLHAGQRSRASTAAARRWWHGGRVQHGWADTAGRRGRRGDGRRRASSSADPVPASMQNPVAW